MIRYIRNEEHYDLLLEQIAKVKHALWINLLSVNEHFEDEYNDKKAFLVSL